MISDTGFFSDGRWHGMADAMRGPEGEAMVEGLNREGFGALLNGDGSAFSESVLDAYWQPFEEGRGRRATLDFYRSMDFEKLAPWDGKLAGLGVPALILWGAEDPFAVMAAAKRFDRELPDSQLVADRGGRALRLVRRARALRGRGDALPRRLTGSAGRRPSTGGQVSCCSLVLAAASHVGTGAAEAAVGAEPATHDVVAAVAAQNVVVVVADQAIGSAATANAVVTGSADHDGRPWGRRQQRPRRGCRK